MVVGIEVLFQLTPNKFNKLNFDLTDSFDNWFLFKLFVLDWLVNNLKASSKVFTNEVYVLLEWNETVFVGIEDLKYGEKVLLGWSDFNEEKIIK